MRDVSILIPARHETWLTNTIDDVLAHRKADTEILVGLDGGWAESPIPQHPDVHVVYRPVARGQRGMTNDLAAMSGAKYVMKLDAHCSVADGFDVTLIETAERLGPTVTQVPQQFNKHVFDWVCQSCKARQYQGPTPLDCACGSPAWEMELVWQRRMGRLTEAWAFDQDLKFCYWGGWKDQQLAGGKDPDVIDTLSCLGACWFVSRERWHQLGGLDEGHGSWGQVGTSVACKSWLSGGRLVTNRRTWFAHLFRTQHGFGFPFTMEPGAQERARAYSQKLWRGNEWPGQIYPLRWLIDRFWPIKGWTEEAREALPLTLRPRPVKQFVPMPSRFNPDGSCAGLTMSPDPSRALLDQSSAALWAQGIEIVRIDTDWTAAAAPSTLGIEMHRSKEMALCAVGLESLGGTAAIPSQDVYALRHDAQMDGIAATAVVADVIDHEIMGVPGQRTNQPCHQDTMNEDFRTRRSSIGESQPGILTAGIDVAGPEPTAIRDRDFRKQASQLPAIKVGYDKLSVSHASASSADVGLGAAPV